MAELERLSATAFAAADKLAVHLVLDNVRSALNVGAIFRTADAFAVAQVHLCGITAQPPHREIMKTALGATDTVTWAYHATAADCTAVLQALGARIYVVEQTHGSVSLAQFVAPTAAPLALVLGNEVRGVSDEWLAAADGAIEVPQFGTKHSLNVSVCAGIVTWEMVRQWRGSQLSTSS